MPLRCTLAFRRTLSMTKLKRWQDKVPYLKPRTVSKDSERSIPTWTELLELLNVILYSHISFAYIPSSHMVPKTHSLMVLSKALAYNVDIKLIAFGICWIRQIGRLLIQIHKKKENRNISKKGFLKNFEYFLMLLGIFILPSSLIIIFQSNQC